MESGRAWGLGTGGWEAQGEEGVSSLLCIGCPMPEHARQSGVGRVRQCSFVCMYVYAYAHAHARHTQACAHTQVDARTLSCSSSCSHAMRCLHQASTTRSSASACEDEKISPFCCCRCPGDFPRLLSMSISTGPPSPCGCCCCCCCCCLPCRARPAAAALRAALSSSFLLVLAA